jgi:hypothetical protein
MNRIIPCLIGLGLSLVGLRAAEAAESAAPAPAKPDRGAFVVAAKVGGIAPFNGLDPFVVGVAELGYVAPWLRRSFSLLVDVGYTVPSTSGTESDPRVEGGSYAWTLTHKQLVIAPTVNYRFTSLGRVVPYVGIGPRIYLIEDVTEGRAGQAVIAETHERSTEVGVFAPVGAQLALGPGFLLGELLFEWGPLDHVATGESHSAGGTLQLGYRMEI